jgi:trigger factor
MTPEPVAITDDDVASMIERMRHQQATWEPVDRAVGFNDLAVFDIESDAGDKPLIKQNGAQYQVLENYSAPVPGFAEQLIGLKRDESKEFKLPVPEDYPDKEIAGKEASFRVKISEVKQEKLPELNDEFAKGIDPKFETLDSLRAQVADNLKLRAEEKSRLDFEEGVIDAAVDQSEVEFPPLLVEMETSRLLDQQLRYWRESGRGLDEYLASINKTEEELREELRPPATKRVTRSLVLGKISQEEKIEVSDPEIDAEIEDTIKTVGEDKQNEFRRLLNTPQSHDSIKQILIRRKTIQRLVAIAKGPDSSTEPKQKKTKKKEAAK